MDLRAVLAFLRAAMECSIYLAPTEPGLTLEELHEAGKRASFLPGEIGDAFNQLIGHQIKRQANRFLPDTSVTIMLSIFDQPRSPEYRNVKAFDVVYSQFNNLIREVGGANARIGRSVVVERAVAQGIPVRDVEAAIAISILCNSILEEAGVLRTASGQQFPRLASQAQSQMILHRQGRHDEVRERAYLIVQDIIERRKDGRSKYAEPLDSFIEALDSLGYKSFRIWWAQIISELRRCNDQESPVSTLVLSAAVIEATLTFIVKYARNQNTSVFRSKDFEREPRHWKIDDLVASAASGGQDAVLDSATRQRVERLIHARQRIHAGRMLSDFPQGISDLRPEEARDARLVSDEVVRRVLDWLDRFPPNSAPT